uniref:Uncharacterized protein n=1 Tax=Chrysotila carterae TaxID=13221 RepID=A0A7S4AZA5_CHRCT|mmetsp:Transcript_49257/g.106695  ORF Transcript_49257/g.106695 Transcript_49257/m.106695 type:complete len:301 (+) Transcript_49257:272-1174(+)
MPNDLSTRPPWTTSTMARPTEVPKTQKQLNDLVWYSLIRTTPGVTIKAVRPVDPVHESAAWTQRVEKEVAKGGRIPLKKPAKLNQVCNELSKEGQWKQALSDPCVAAAMLKVQRRVEQLEQQAKTGVAEPSQWAFRAMNQRGDAPHQTSSSIAHPLACAPHRALAEQRAATIESVYSSSASTRRKAQAKRAQPSVMLEMTGLWSVGFELAAPTTGLDLNADFSRCGSVGETHQREHTLERRRIARPASATFRRSDSGGAAAQRALARPRSAHPAASGGRRPQNSMHAQPKAASMQRPPAM